MSSTKVINILSQDNRDANLEKEIKEKKRYGNLIKMRKDNEIMWMFAPFFNEANDGLREDGKPFVPGKDNLVKGYTPPVVQVDTSTSTQDLPKINGGINTEYTSPSDIHHKTKYASELQQSMEDNTKLVSKKLNDELENEFESKKQVDQFDDLSQNIPEQRMKGGVELEKGYPSEEEEEDEYDSMEETTIDDESSTIDKVLPDHESSTIASSVAKFHEFWESLNNRKEEEKEKEITEVDLDDPYNKKHKLIITNSQLENKRFINAKYKITPGMSYPLMKDVSFLKLKETPDIRIRGVSLSFDEGPKFEITYKETKQKDANERRAISRFENVDIENTNKLVELFLDPERNKEFVDKLKDVTFERDTTTIKGKGLKSKKEVKSIVSPILVIEDVPQAYDELIKRIGSYDAGNISNEIRNEITTLVEYLFEHKAIDDEILKGVIEKIR